MNLFGFFGFPGHIELIIIGIVAVLLFGNRLPGIARSIGSSFIEFKKGLRGVEKGVAEVQEELDDVDRTVRRTVSGRGGSS